MRSESKRENLFLESVKEFVEQTLLEKVEANPLPPALKQSILQELLGGPEHAAPILNAAGFTSGETRPLTLHEKATLEAITGNASDAGTWSLLAAVRKTRGDEIMAWADLAGVATEVRLGGCT